MTHALEQSGTLHPMIQATNNRSHQMLLLKLWPPLLGPLWFGFWRDVRLIPPSVMRYVTPSHFPTLGSVKLDAAGTIHFIKETPCALGPDTIDVASNSLEIIMPTAGAPGTTRTCDPLIRSQVLYPAELRVRSP